jgi:hypothetical protein
MPPTRTLVAVATLALVVACTENGSFVEPAEDRNPESLTPDALLSVLDASGPTGIEGFRFMPAKPRWAWHLPERLRCTHLPDHHGQRHRRVVCPGHLSQCGEHPDANVLRKPRSGLLDCRAVSARLT